MYSPESKYPKTDVEQKPSARNSTGLSGGGGGGAEVVVVVAVLAAMFVVSVMVTRHRNEFQSSREATKTTNRPT